MGKGRRLDGKKETCGSKMDMRDFVIFALMNVKHSVVIHRPTIGECVKANRKINQEIGRQSVPLYCAVKVPPYNMEQRALSEGEETLRQNRRYSKNTTLVVEEERRTT